MRISSIIAVLALLVATPAAADITARYAVSQGRMPAFIVQVNDRGDSRISSGNQMAVLTLGGVTYILMADLAGTFAVRQEDMMAAFADMVPVAARTAPASGDYRIVETGRETVGGRSGVVLALRSGEEEEPVSGFDFVVNADADLAPVGRALARQFSASADGLGAMLGNVPAFAANSAAIMSRGTVIRVGRLLHLESIDTGPVPETQFALPGPLLTRAQFAARMGWSPPR